MKGDRLTSPSIADADRLRMKFLDAAFSIRRDINKALRQSGLLVVKQAQINVTGPRPSHLGVGKGRLRSSLSSVMQKSGVVMIGTNVEYARIHEFGGKTSAHFIVAGPGKVLAFQARSNTGIRRLGALGAIGDSDMVFRKVVYHPGSRMPARPYLRPALETKRPEIINLVRSLYSGPLSLGGQAV